MNYTDPSEAFRRSLLYNFAFHYNGQVRARAMDSDALNPETARFPFENVIIPDCEISRRKWKNSISPRVRLKGSLTAEEIA